MTARRALGLVVLAGAALRFATLDTQSLWFDETVTGQLLRMNLGEMLRAIPGSESTPPLYYVLAWLWTQVAGTGEVGMRSLSALFGTATIVVVWALGRRLGGDRAGLAAAALVAFNPLLIWFSQEARSYALLALLGALSTLVWLRALEEQEREHVGHSALLAWGAIAAIALATHYFAVFFLAPQALWLLIRGPDMRQRAIALVLPLTTAAALAPLAMSQQSDERAAFIGDTALLTRILHIPGQFLVGYYTPLAVLVGALTMFAVVGGVAGLRELAGARAATSPSTATRADTVRVAVVTLSAVVLPLVGAPFGQDYVITRNVLAALPLTCALIGAGLMTFAGHTSGHTRAAVAALALACLAGTITAVTVASDPERQRDNWRDAVRALGPITGPRLIVATPTLARSPLAYYLPDARVRTAGARTYTTAEIDYVALPLRLVGQRERAKPVRPAHPVAPAAGYTLAGRTYGATFTVIRWRSPTPQAEPIAPSPGLDGEDAALLTIDPASGAR